MSRLIMHRKDKPSLNFSLDIKAYHNRNSSVINNNNVIQKTIQSPVRKTSFNQNLAKSYSRIQTKKKLSTDLHYNPQKSFFRPTAQFYTSKFKRKLSSSKTWKINSSVSIDTHLFDQKYQKVSKLMKRAKYFEAIDILQSTLPFSQPSEQLRQMYLWLAIAHSNSGNQPQCIKVLTVIIQLFPDFQEAYLFRSKIYSKLNRHKDASNDLQSLLKINPKNVQAYISWGQNQQLRGNIDKAIQIWNFGRTKNQSLQLNKLIIENKIKMKKFQEVQKQLKQLSAKMQKNSSNLLYLYGIYQKQKQQLNEACIYFQQAIKYNNSQNSVRDSLYNLLKIRIQQRDYYAAFHASSRINFLGIKGKKLLSYRNFLEAVILIMKKKFSDAIKILQNQTQDKYFNKTDSFLKPLYFKFLGFAYFKIGKHLSSTQAYYKLKAIDGIIDDVSRYNLCLAEGVRAVDQMHHFDIGYRKFAEANQIFPKKVEPFIYLAVTTLKQKLSNSKNNRKAVIMSALKQLDKGQIVNSSSSNLLFHRTILHLAMGNWDLAHNDINKCIEKAQQNLPKYFYIRGMCYACVKDFTKAINQYSISISLDAQFDQGYLQRAKSQFLIGQSESGFRDLKHYMQLRPDDLAVHKWIGDLLYEGKSYHDAIRAYSQCSQNEYFQLFQMRAKCYFRIGKLQQVKNCLKVMDKIQVPAKYQNKDKVVEVDFVALKLLVSLLKNESDSTLSTHTKELNKYLEDSKTGYIFQLIDCMNLLGIAAFYLQKYEEAYQSFMLTLQLYQSFSTKQSLDLKSQSSQQGINLQLDKIVYNMFLCQAITGQSQKALTLFQDEQIIESCSKFQFGRQFKTIADMVMTGQQNLIVLQPNQQDSIFNKLKTFQIKLFNVKLKTRLFFGLYHESPDQLFCIQVAQNKVNQLSPSFIDNNPEGPWIRRNEYGVIFTEQIIEQQGTEWVDSSKNTSSRVSERQQNDNDDRFEQDFLNEKQKFKEMMKLDVNLENRLMKVLKKQANSDYSVK